MCIPGPHSYPGHAFLIGQVEFSSLSIYFFSLQYYEYLKFEEKESEKKNPKMLLATNTGSLVLCGSLIPLKPSVQMNHGII